MVDNYSSFTSVTLSYISHIPQRKTKKQSNRSVNSFYFLAYYSREISKM